MVKWFWEVSFRFKEITMKSGHQVVDDDFDEERKARLLQFVTGTSGV